MPLLDRGDSVLIVIDAQAGFLDKVDADTAADVVDRIRWLVLVARKLDTPVVVTEEEPEQNGPTAEPISAVLPPGTVRHVKPTFGLAGDPDIVADIASTGRRTTVLVGLETDVCIAHSAIGMKEHGWTVTVVEDAIASPATGHAQGLTRLREEGLTMLGVKAVAYDWLRSVELANRVFGDPDLAARAVSRCNPGSPSAHPSATHPCRVHTPVPLIHAECGRGSGAWQRVESATPGRNTCICLVTDFRARTRRQFVAPRCALDASLWHPGVHSTGFYSGSLCTSPPMTYGVV